MSLANPLQVTALVGVIAWPLAAGVAVVFWSKARASAHARKTAAIEAGLKGLYSEIERQPVPPRLSLVADALEEGEALKAAPRRAPRKGGIKSSAR